MANSTKAALPSYALAAIVVNRAQSDEACNRIEAFLAKIQRTSATGSFFWRAATAEIAASEQVYRIFELDPALPLTLELMASRVHPDDLPMFHALFEQVRNADSDVDVELRLRISDGSVKYLRLMANGIGEQAGEMEYIGAVHDVTDLRLSEEALGQARAALTHMARLTTLEILTPSIAHEVTQPLAGIMTNAHTCLRALAANPPSLDGARAAARRALRDVERAHELITRLRMLVAKKEVTPESLDLNEAIREAVGLLSSELQKHRVVVRTEFAGDLPRVRGDRLQLQQVVINLLANSLEAMSYVEDRPRLLLIKTDRHEGAQVCATVRDAGLGFRPRDAERLFISRSIIERHSGSLWAASNVGSGATFSFALPAEPKA